MPAADREHRHEPRGRRVGRADPGVAALARDRLGRAGHLPARPDGRGAHATPSGSSPRARPTRTRARSASACPTRASVGWDDAVRGRIEFENEKLADLVIVRSDGRPTYNFASPGRGHARRDHARDPRQRPRLEHADADQHPAARSAPSCRSTRTCPTCSATTARSSRSATARSSVDVFRADGYLPAGADELPRAARLELRRQDDDHDAGRADRAVLARARRRRARRRSTTRSSTG